MEEEKVSKRQLILVGIAVLLTGILLIVKPSHSVFQVNKTINIMDAKVGNFGNGCSGIKNLKDCILASNGGSTAIEAKGNPTFNKAPVSQEYYDLQYFPDEYVVENGMWAMEDEYGTSYYFRGGYDVLNNNLIFAGFQWKVIRINGDGSIRLLYNGTCSGNIIPCDGIGMNQYSPVGIAGSIGKFVFGTENSQATFGEAKYVGYMYGGPIGVASSSYAEATQSIKGVSISSNAKTVLESWYATNLLSQGNSITDKVVDNLFCNDRKPSSNPSSIDYLGGYGNLATQYGSVIRSPINTTLDGYVNPTLLCQNAHPSVTLTNDQFTVSQITYNHPITGSKTVGNGALTYPIGLVTLDEAFLAGVYRTSLGSFKNYLSSSSDTWTMSPYTFGGGGFGIACVFVVRSGGEYSLGQQMGEEPIRPVINLSSTVEISSGDGSLTNPFIIAP